MHHPEIVEASPLLWTPTRGNDIPPHAVPISDGYHGPLYIARGLLRGEMHIGTTSFASTEGAQLQDKYGRSHAVYEYEVLTCASSLRFHLEASQLLTFAAETETASQWSVRRDSVVTASRRTPSPPPKKTPGKLAPFPWLSPPRGRPAPIPNETGKKRHQNEPPPYTSPTGGWIEVPKHPDPMALKGRENVQFKHLTQCKCFTLIDDTPSMQSSWSQTRAALAGLVDILSSDDTWNGLDVRFLHHTRAHPCVKTRTEFESIFNSVTTFRGEKVMAGRVAQVFGQSLPLIHETPCPRPVVVLIFTDGMASDTQELFDAMVHFCQKLNGKCIPPHMFRIHILQMGEDRKAVKPLHDFRDRVTQRDRDRRILNVVSFHRGRGPLNAQNIFKLLLSSTYIPDEEDPDLGERQPPGVVEAQYGDLERIRAMGVRHM